MGDRWIWPLPEAEIPVPVKGDRAFAAVRKHDVHPGVDLVCKPGSRVRAVQYGTVLFTPWFTGPRAGSPWWLPTCAVVVCHADGSCVLYGEIRPRSELCAGTTVLAGDFLGVVRPVRRHSLGTIFGCKPRAMLHLERWASADVVLPRYTDAAALDPNDWPLGGKRPAGLLDPTAMLARAVHT